MHDAVVNELEEHLAGTASPEFHAHLAACPDCRAEVGSMTEMSQLLSELRADPEMAAAPSPYFYTRVAASIVEHQNTDHWGLLAPGAAFFRRVAFASLVVLACLGYGAVFLLLSMIFRNPTPAAMLVMGWEAINPVMPSLLQKISVASYLRHLMPITVPGDGIFALLTVQTEPVPTSLAVLGLLILTAAILAYSCIRIRRLEIRYTTD